MNDANLRSMDVKRSFDSMLSNTEAARHMKAIAAISRFDAQVYENQSDQFTVGSARF